MTDDRDKLLARSCEVEVYLGEGIWWRIERHRLPKSWGLPMRPSRALAPIAQDDGR